MAHRCAGRGLALVCGLIMALQPFSATARQAEVPRDWAKLQKLETPRTGHSATLLKNGHVLVAGGHRTFGQIEPGMLGAPGLRDGAISKDPAERDRQSAEWQSFIGDLAEASTYDPVSSKWRQVKPMLTPRFGHTATLLSDGRVLVVGGLARGVRPGNLPLDSAEFYDPKTGSWGMAPSMNDAIAANTSHLDSRIPDYAKTGPAARAFHSATLLKDGRVLVAGGLSGGHNPAYVPDALLFDPEKGAWSSTDSLGIARMEHAATLLTDGNLLVTGGSGFDGEPLGQAEIYDPVQGTWTPKGMKAARASHTATLLSDGRVLVVGGTTNNPAEPTDSVEVYDPKKNSFQLASALRTPRMMQGASALSTGGVLIIGGFGGARGVDPLYSSEMLEARGNRWIQLPDVRNDKPSPVDAGYASSTSATLLSQRPCGGNCGRVLAIGGTLDSPISHLVSPLAFSESKAGDQSDRTQQPASPLPAMLGLVAAGTLGTALLLLRRRRHLKVAGA